MPITDIQVDYSGLPGGYEFSWMVDVSADDNGSLTVPLLNGTGVKRMNIFSQQYAPQKTSFTAAEVATGSLEVNLSGMFEHKDPDGTEFFESEGIIAPRAHAWDSAKIGIGAPPIKTDEGWLLIYQAVGYHDSSKYKAGAMLLDLGNPAKVVYRSSRPILEPTEIYENNGHKAGVVYACGAVIKDDDLLVYYGGADTVSCVARANIHEFLYQLKGSGAATLESETLH